jgi:menaquinone-dependent protoporphyrinogen oxidase
MENEMAHVLIAYGTRQGHTKVIADRIAASIRASGHEVDATDLHESPQPRPEAYDAVVVGASVHMGDFEREVVRWVHENVQSIAARRNAFYSVALTSATQDAVHDGQIAAVLDKFVRATGWAPARIESFAGALEYSKYNWLTKRIMRHIVRREQHGPYTDMARDYDLTNYEEVDAFARDLAASLSMPSHA